MNTQIYVKIQTIIAKWCIYPEYRLKIKLVNVLVRTAVIKDMIKYIKLGFYFKNISKCRYHISFHKTPQKNLNVAHVHYLCNSEVFFKHFVKIENKIYFTTTEQCFQNTNNCWTDLVVVFFLSFSGISVHFHTDVWFFFPFPEQDSGICLYNVEVNSPKAANSQYL